MFDSRHGSQLGSCDPIWAESHPNSGRCAAVQLPQFRWQIGRLDAMTPMNEEVIRIKDRADELAAEGDLAGALLAFQSGVAFTPNDAVLHEAIAQIQSELDDHAAALTAAAKAVDLAPEVRLENAEDRRS